MARSTQHDASSSLPKISQATAIPVEEDTANDDDATAPAQLDWHKAFLDQEEQLHVAHADVDYFKEKYHTLLQATDDFGRQHFIFPTKNFFPDNHAEQYQKFRFPLYSDWNNGVLDVEPGSLGFEFADRNDARLRVVFLTAMQNRSKLLFKFARETGSAGCANVSCGAMFPSGDEDRRNFIAICCPKCCNVLYCSMSCMARHANFHSAACVTFKGYGVPAGFERSAKRARAEFSVTDPRLPKVDDLPKTDAVIPLKTSAHQAVAVPSVAVPAAVPVVAQAAITLVKMVFTNSILLVNFLIEY